MKTNKLRALHATFLCLFCVFGTSKALFAGQILGPTPGCARLPGPNLPVNIYCGEATVPPSAHVDPVERAAYTAFYDEENVDAKIHLGEQFDQKYPDSIYEDSVDSALTSLYYNKQDWAKFYATGEKVIAKNPKNFPILELVGWAIPRNSNADPLAAAKFDEAINYEKRALALIAAMKKPKEIDQQDFDSSIEGLSWRAYSGLGLAYFRKKDYADSATALQTAIKDEGPEPDAGDLRALGVDLENLNRKSEAIGAFSRCFQISGDLQDRCEQDLQKAKAELAGLPEDAAYEAFLGANTDAQIQLGEKFDQAYPASEYEERVDTALAGLYRAKQDWSKFYAAADKVLAKDANNIPMLASVAWAIPHNYDPSAPDASAKLDKAEKYGKHALDLIAAMQKPPDLSQEQFDQAKEQAAAQAHSGLGIAFFRRGDFVDSANELQLATADASQAGAFDLYILGIDLQKVNRGKDAAEAFGKCAAMPGNLEAQCNRDSEMASKAAVQLTAVATKPAANSTQPSARDIPPLTEQESGRAIKSETLLVPVRVVVRNAKGDVVAGLKRDDFKLYQDGKQVEIGGFNAIGVMSNNGMVTSAMATTPPATGSTTVIAPTTTVPAVQPDRFIGLFFDDFHLTSEDLVQTREAAEKYLATLQPTDRAAIMTSSGEGETDFTADRDKLTKAMLNIKPHPASGLATAAKDCPPMSYAEADAIINKENQEILQGATTAALICAFANDPYLTPAARSLALNTARAELFEGNLQTSAIFRRLQGEVQRLSAMAGERNLVLVSRGFNYETHEAEFSELIDRAIRANVTVNALDAKGMYVSDDDRDASSLVTAHQVRMESFQDVEKLNRMGQAENNYVLSDLADATGGIFFHADNGFAAGFKELAAPPEAYYLLSYTPQNLPADGKYHALKVALARRSSDRVQARRGFYAPSHLETPEEAAKREIENALFSQDQQNDLPVKLETASLPGTSGAEKLTVKANVDPAQLTFQKHAGMNQEDLTVAAALFDENGNYVAGTQKDDQMNLDDATLARLDKSGFYVELDFDVKPGNYVVRLVARDSNDGHIAAQSSNVTIPNEAPVR